MVRYNTVLNLSQEFRCTEELTDILLCLKASTIPKLLNILSHNVSLFCKGETISYVTIFPNIIHIENKIKKSVFMELFFCEKCVDIE